MGTGMEGELLLERRAVAALDAVGDIGSNSGAVLLLRTSNAIDECEMPE